MATSEPFFVLHWTGFEQRVLISNRLVLGWREDLGTETILSIFGSQQALHLFL